MYQDYGLYIDGGWRPAASGEVYAPVNPATEEALGEAPSAGEADVHAAIAAAERGLAVWRKTDPWERARIIRRIGDLMSERVDDLAKWLTLELGKPLAQSKGEVGPFGRSVPLVRRGDQAHLRPDRRGAHSR